MSQSQSQSHFFDVYRRNDAPWDIGGPQGALKCLAEVGTIEGDVLDVGCGVARVGRELASLCGAYTGADRNRPGTFSSMDIFLTDQLLYQKIHRLNQ